MGGVIKDESSTASGHMEAPYELGGCFKMHIKQRPKMLE